MFGQKSQPQEPLTDAQQVAKHRAAAEELLHRAGKAGRLEAETRWAAMATAHATLALSYQLPVPVDQPTV